MSKLNIFTSSKTYNNVTFPAKDAVGVQGEYDVERKVAAAIALAVLWSTNGNTALSAMFQQKGAPVTFTLIQAIDKRGDVEPRFVQLRNCVGLLLKMGAVVTYIDKFTNPNTNRWIKTAVISMHVPAKYFVAGFEDYRVVGGCVPLYEDLYALSKIK